jgi:hypothetical protein
VIGRRVNPFPLRGRELFGMVTVLGTFSRPISKPSYLRGIFKLGLDIEIVQEIHTIHIVRQVSQHRKAMKYETFHSLVTSINHGDAQSQAVS